MANIRYEAQLCAVGGRAEPSGRRGPSGGALSVCVTSRLPFASAASENAGTAASALLLHLTLDEAKAKNEEAETGEDEEAAATARSKRDGESRGRHARAVSEG